MVTVVFTARWQKHQPTSVDPSSFENKKKKNKRLTKKARGLSLVTYHQKMGISGVSDTLEIVSQEELRKHNRAEDCWIVLHSKVYDVSSFLVEHPGGAGSKLKCAEPAS